MFGARQQEIIMLNIGYDPICIRDREGSSK